MTGFVKLDCGIVDSTIWAEPDDVLRAWIALLAKCDAHGVAKVTIPALAILCRANNQRMAEIMAIFESPDRYSRNDANEGRRVEKIEGGYLILNYGSYRAKVSAEEKREADRKRIAEKRHVAKSRKESRAVADVAQAEAEAEAEAKSKSTDASRLSPQTAKNPPPADACPHSEIISAYHEILPELARVRSWDADRQSLLRARWRSCTERQSVAWWREFFEYVRRCPFLLGQVESAHRDPFLADLEWLVRPKNFRKVIEGKYESREAA